LTRSKPIPVRGEILPNPIHPIPRLHAVQGAVADDLKTVIPYVFLGIGEIARYHGDILIRAAGKGDLHVPVLEILVRAVGGIRLELVHNFYRGQESPNGGVAEERGRIALEIGIQSVGAVCPGECPDQISM